MINFVSRYLLILLVIPSIALLLVLTYNGVININNYRDILATATLNQFALQGSALTHELQKERGMSAALKAPVLSASLTINASKPTLNWINSKTLLPITENS